MSDRGERRRRTENVVRRRKSDWKHILVWPLDWPDGMLRKERPFSCREGRNCRVCHPDKGTPTLQEQRANYDEPDQ